MPHIHEKIDFCSEVFIVFKDKVLLRKHDKYKYWLSVGGHIELGDDPVEAALREVKEEVGLDVTLYSPEDLSHLDGAGGHSLIKPQYLFRHRINEVHEHVAFVYFATAKTDKLILSETEITAGCHWFTKQELEKNEHGIRPLTRFHALKALEKLA